MLIYFIIYLFIYILYIFYSPDYSSFRCVEKYENLNENLGVGDNHTQIPVKS